MVSHGKGCRTAKLGSDAGTNSAGLGAAHHPICEVREKLVRLQPHQSRGLAPQPGPHHGGSSRHSLSPATHFVVDHAPCSVLLV